MATMNSNRATYALTALVAIMTLALTTGCAGDAAPEPESDSSRQELLDTIERMDREMDTLREEVVELSEAKENQRPSTGSQQVDREPKRDATAEPTVDPTPEMAAIPTPSGPGICGRSPEIQKEILKSLKISLCQAVSEPEMFRITDLPEIGIKDARAGDFVGLVNVKELKVSAVNVHPNAFTGLVGLRVMRLSIGDEGTISDGAFQSLPKLEEMALGIATNGSIGPGAFQGLSSIETLRIQLNEVSEDENTFDLPDFAGIPNLKSINIGWFETNTVASSPFGNMPNLESAEISIQFKHDEPRVEKPQIPGSMFKNNPTLKRVELTLSSNEREGIHIPAGLFADNPLLEEIQIHSGQTRVPRDTFKHLENLKALSMQQFRTSEGWEYNKVTLHESSPLYSVITLGGRQPEGYRLANEP